MPRIRQIKPSFFASEDIAAIRSYRARLTFIGLWTHVDDNGRCRDNVRLVRAAVWPLEDDVTLADVEHDLAELARLGRIKRYDSPDGPCIQVSNFDRHQKINRPSKTTLHGPNGEDPQPSDPATQPHTAVPPRHTAVTTEEPVTHSGVHEPSLSSNGVAAADVATCGNVIQGQFTEPSASPHGALSEPSRSTHHRYGYGYGYGYGGGTREDDATSAPVDTVPAIAADAAPPRCRRHRNLPDDDPGPQCVGCRSVRLARLKAAEDAERRRAEEARQARIDRQMAARRPATAGASPSARQAARDAYRASQARKRATS